MPIKRGHVVRMAHISAAYVCAHRDVLFVFGDNMARRGRGGQAAAMRDEPNAVGIPTKWIPSNSPDAFFQDRDWDVVRNAIVNPFGRLREELAGGRIVVIPSAGLGTGYADLPRKAPFIHTQIERRIAALEAAFPAPPD